MAQKFGRGIPLEEKPSLVDLVKEKLNLTGEESRSSIKKTASWIENHDDAFVSRNRISRRSKNRKMETVVVEPKQESGDADVMICPPLSDDNDCSGSDSAGEMYVTPSNNSTEMDVAASDPSIHIQQINGEQAGSMSAYETAMVDLLKRKAEKQMEYEEAEHLAKMEAALAKKRYYETKERLALDGFKNNK